MNLAIETVGLSKSYGPVQAVKSVSLRVGRGEIYGFIGRNGAGRTTTIRALLASAGRGYLPPLGWAAGRGVQRARYYSERTRFLLTNEPGNLTASSYVDPAP